MWIDIKGRFYNLDHYAQIYKMIDECESYKDYCIKLVPARKMTKLDYKLIVFGNKNERDQDTYLE